RTAEKLQSHTGSTGLTVGSPWTPLTPCETSSAPGFEGKHAVFRDDLVHHLRRAPARRTVRRHPRRAGGVGRGGGLGGQPGRVPRGRARRGDGGGGGERGRGGGG